MKADLELEAGVIDQVGEDVHGAGSERNAFLIRFAYHLNTMKSVISYKLLCD